MTMNYQQIILELPELTDESAAALQNFGSWRLCVELYNITP